MTQAEQLPKNVNALIDKVIELKSKTFLVPPIPKIEITQLLLTKRQIAKKILLVSSGVISSAGQVVQSASVISNTTITSANSLGADIPSDGVTDVMSNYDVNFALNASQMIGQVMTPETSHFIVYGKFKRNADGTLIDNEILDPDCVLHKLAMPETHPTFSEIQVMIAKVNKLLKMLSIKQQDMLDDIAQALISIPASVTSIAAAAAILPPGAGVPVAFSAFQGLIANIMNIVTKISGVAVDLEYLNYIPLLVDAQKLDAILGLVNAQIMAINTVLDTIDALTKIIPNVPTPPGVGVKPGDPVKVEATATPNMKSYNVPVDIILSAKASNGSWDYNYQWSGPNNFKSTDKEVTIKGGPFVTTEYTVTAIDKKDSANTAKSTILVEVTM